MGLDHSRSLGDRLVTWSWGLTSGAEIKHPAQFQEPWANDSDVYSGTKPGSQPLQSVLAHSLSTPLELEVSPPFSLVLGMNC